MECCRHAQIETSSGATLLILFHHQCFVHGIMDVCLPMTLQYLEGPIAPRVPECGHIAAFTGSSIVMTPESHGVSPLPKYAQMPSVATQVYKSYKSELTEHPAEWCCGDVSGSLRKE